MKKRVEDLVKGDTLYVENNYGEFELRTVGASNKYHVLVNGGLRFMRKSGWETSYRSTAKDLKAGKRARYRIHLGDGNLFTPDQVRRFTYSQVREGDRAELIYTAIRTSPVTWRNLTDEQLVTVNQWLGNTLTLKVVQYG